MKARIVFSTFALVVWATIHLTSAQQSIDNPRIGFLAPGFPAPHPAPLNDNFKAFHEGLHELGYIEGRNVFIEYRYTKGRSGRLLEFAEELVRLKVNVIVAPTTPSIRAAKEATSKIPIVMVSASDPVAKFVDTLSRPGGNITGVSGLASELSGKLMEVITEAVPEANRVGVLWHPRAPPDSLTETKIAARALKRQLQIVEVRGSDEFEQAMQALSENRVRALILLPAVLFARNERRIAELAVKNRLATIFWRSQFADAGGLMAYGPRIPDLWHRAGVLVGKILKGAKPANLPVEQPMKFDLVINLKTAKQIGLTIPANVLARADKVIK